DYASASSVYLQTRVPEFAEGRRHNLKATLKGGSFDTVDPSILYERKLGKSLSNSLNVEYLYTSGRYKFTYKKLDGYDTTAVRQNGDVRALRVEDGLFGALKDGGWRAKAYFYDSERGYPGAFVREEPGKFRHEDRQWDCNFFLQDSWFKNVSSWYKVSTKAKFSWDYLHYISDPRLDVTTMYVNNTYIQKEAYFSGANEFKPCKWWDVNLASDWQYNTLSADLVDFVCPSRFTELTALANSFAFKKLKFQTSLLFTHVHDYAKSKAAAAGKKNVFTPTFVFQYTPFGNDDFSFRGFYKKIFRMPTLNDLYYTFIGNKYLKPEYTTQYDFGAAYSKLFIASHFKRFDANLDIYYNQVKDKII
ncbi:MAG: TonB-dependent receptor, partial [Bacteroidales bacterium]